MDTSGTQSAADRVYEHVRAGLLSRRIAANELLSEGQIAEAVGVSRTPVREAFLRLQSEGLLRLLPKRGALVLPVTADEMADVLEVRRLIETFATRKAVTHGPAVAARLEPHLAAMRTALREHDTSAYVLADRAFHAEIVASTGNAVITELYRTLRDRQLRMGSVSVHDPSGAPDTGRMRSMLVEHETICAAIAAKTIRAAESAVGGHLDRAADHLARRS